MRVQHFADWLQGQIGPLGILLAIAVVAVVALYLLAKSREWRLASKRSGFNEDSFAEQLAAEGMNPRTARIVYEYLRDVQKVPFPMMPEDSLDETLGLSGSDLEETIMSVLRLAGREGLPGLTVLPPETLRELVEYVEKSPKASGANQAKTSGAFPMQRGDIRTSSGVVPKAIVR